MPAPRLAHPKGLRWCLATSWGQVLQTWGDVPYPEQRSYNQFGDLATVTTYRGGSQWSGPTWPASTGVGDTTYWFYDEATGLLTNKTDAAGRTVYFTYYDNYMPQSRIWARGAASTNIYSPINLDLLCIDYSDGTTVAFTNADFPTLDRQGKPSVIMDASGTRLLTYDYAERLVSTHYTTGLLAGITITNHIHPVHGRDLLQVQGITPSLTDSYGYDTYGRLSTVACGIYSAAYTYLPNSDLLQATTCASNNTVVLTTTRTWETGPRLRSIVNTANGAVVTSHQYGYDTLDRRTSALLENDSQWRYQYNDRNELTGAQRFWADWTPVAGQQFGYAYDNIGNRTSASFGGDANGANLRTTIYGANSLNQYTNITNPGYQSILGLALATNTVAVTNTSIASGGLADRKGEYFHRELPTANGSGPVWQSVAVNSGSTTTNGGLVLPSSSQVLTNDADGNLIFDGVWAYQWDCENRLVTMTMTNVAGVPDADRLRLEFTYDHEGRRVAKTAKSWNPATQSYTNATVARFVYDLTDAPSGGWNLIAATDASLHVNQGFLWGLDLSATEDGAGGVGGLLGTCEVAGSQISNCQFASYDGNGNISALTSASDGSLSARYEYSPFGQTLRATGRLAKANPYRFSTRFADDESSLLAYPKRYYSPGTAVWLTRDPLEEQGGDNLYAFVQGNPLNSTDPLGAFTLIDVGATSGTIGELSSTAAQMYGYYTRVKSAVDSFNTAQQLTSILLDQDADESAKIGALIQMTLIGADMLSGGLRKKTAVIGNMDKLGRYKSNAEIFETFTGWNEGNPKVKNVKAMIQWCKSIVERGDKEILIASGTRFTSGNGKWTQVEINYFLKKGYKLVGQKLIKQ